MPRKATTISDSSHGNKYYLAVFLFKVQRDLAVIKNIPHKFSTVISGYSEYHFSCTYLVYRNNRKAIHSIVPVTVNGNIVYWAYGYYY